MWRVGGRRRRGRGEAWQPKAIKRIAVSHEIRTLMDKEGNEAKAKRACQQKVYRHYLDMEILETEFEW